ncbi:hypothetical protein LAZ67_18000997, partial [Cordylochernes scorpioides]
MQQEGRETPQGEYHFKPIRNPSIFSGEPGQSSEKWLKEYHRVARFNCWDSSMCLANVYFFLSGTAKVWFENVEEQITSWELFETMLSQAFGHHASEKDQVLEKLKARAQGKGESSEAYIQDVLYLCRQINPNMNENEKVAHLVKGVSEEIYRAIVTFEIATTEEFIRWCRKIELSQKKRVNTRIVFDRLPNAAAINPAESESMEDLIRQKGPVLRVANRKHIETLGRCNLKVSIEELEIYFTFVVFSECSHHIILGLDFFRATSAVIDCGRGEIHLKESVNDGLEEDLPTHALEDCFVPARSIKKITVINEDIRGGKDLMIEGSKDLILKKELVIPSSIINFHHGRGEIWVTNGTSQNQIIPAGMLVGYLRKIGSSGIYSVDTAEDDKTQSNIKNEDRRQQILSLVDERLNEEQKSMIAECLEKYSEVFDFDRKSFSTTSNVKHKIDTSDSRPIKQRPYRVSPVERRAIQSEVDKMIKMGIVQPSESPWSSPVVLVKKKDGNDDVLDSLTGAKFFSSMDVRTGYWQIEIDEEDREKTAFITPDGLYEFRVMPFGLCNAPATFERMMDKLLAGLKWTICLCYLDDIIVYATSFKEHIERLGKVLRCIQKAGLCINHEKCRFGSREIKVLGHLVTESGIRPDPDKIEAITNFPTPKTTTEVRSFMGLCSYYRRFVKDFANKAKPLHDLLRNNVKFFWSNEQEQSFQILKSAPTTDPVLGHFKEDAETLVHTDASGYGVGAVLTQLVEGKEKPIAYASRTLNAAERNYSTTERECLAVVWAIYKFKPYLFGKHFTVVSDHHSLCWLANGEDPSGRLARWALRLQEFDISIVYKNGKRHQDADCLSRSPLPQSSEDNIPELYSITDIRKEQRRDVQTKKIIQEIDSKSESGYKIIDGILYRKNYDPMGKPWLLVVPKQMRVDILREAHDAPMAGHLGFAKTYDRVRRKYFWPGLHRSVRQYVAHCRECQRRKGSTERPPGQLVPIPPVSRPFEKIGIDLLGRFPTSNDGNKWTVVATDYLTRYAMTKAIPNGSSEEVGKFIVEDVILKHGAPRELISDRGRTFISHTIRDINNLCGTAHRFTSAYHPQTNGLTERLNKTLGDMLSMYVDVDQRNWDSVLPYVTFAYNTAKQETTGFSPFYLVHGRDVETPLDTILTYREEANLEDYVESLVTNAEDARQLARLNILKAQEKDKSRYDKSHRPVQYRTEDLVWVYTPVRKQGLSEKLLKRYFGPYKVVRQLSEKLEDEDLNDEVENCIDKCIRLKCELDLRHNGQETSEKGVNLHVKMPKLELPTFDGRLESWLSFKDLFFSAVGSNSQIPNIEKLQYLKGQLRGEALRLVNAFPITADNYVEVWQTLLTRYDNPKDLIFTQIDNALRLPKLADDNHKSMFKLLDSCNEIVRTVKVLGYQIDSLSDVFLVKIIQNKLDKTTRKQWELQNNPRVVPSIKDLMEFLEIHAKSLQNLPNKDANVEESSIKRETAPRMEVQPKQWGHPGRSPMDYSSKRRPCRICLNRGHAGRFHPENRNFNSVEFDEKLSPYEKSDLIKLIKENKEAFAAHKMDIGHIKADPIRIKLTSQTPISLKPFRPSFSDNIEIKRQIEELLKYNVIRPSYSSYASPAMLVNKRNEGKIRLVIDYRKLNDIIKRDSEPIPRIDSILDKLSEANIFTTLDLLSGYHHLDIHPDDKEYTAFTTTHGLYEFNKLSFGLKNSPSQFQRVLRQILNKYDVDFCMNYFDDFIIFSNNFQEHLTHLKVILDICIKENIKLKLSKCKFATYQISFLGYEISNHQFSPSTNNIETIRKLNSPRNKKDLQRVLGSINIYSKFIPNYAKLRLPLNNLLKKDVKWKWDEECETAFSKLKNMITSKPILAIYNPKYPIHLYTDASQEQIGSILKQEQPDGLLKPIAYRSRRMTSYESNYCVTEQECLAIIDAVDFFLPYLDGVHFTIHTDHACLKYLKNIKNPKGRLFRWSLKLSMFDFEIKHIRGTENKEADFLSRYPIAHFVSDPELKQAQFDDNINDRKYTKFNGLLTIRKKGLIKSVVPPSLREKVLIRAHQDYGHIGVSKMLNLISPIYYWPYLIQDISNYVKHCEVCQLNKISHQKKFGLLESLPPANDPFDLVSIDTVGGLNYYNSTKKFLHIIVDHATRYIWAFPSKSQTTDSYINCLNKIFQIQKPKQFLSDRAPSFTSPRFRKYLINNNIKQLLTSSSRPQCNGLNERLNQTIITRLRCKFNNLKGKSIPWTKLLDSVLNEYNNTPHSITGYTPTYLLYGKLPYDPPLKESEFYPPIDTARTNAYNNTLKFHQINKIRYDQHYQPSTFKVGDKVWLQTFYHPDNRKLMPPMSGPFTILKQISPVNYEIDKPQSNLGKTTMVIHSSKLRPYYPKEGFELKLTK